MNWINYNLGRTGIPSRRVVGAGGGGGRDSNTFFFYI